MMTLLNLVQPISCGQSQYLLQALSAHSSYRFSIDTSQGIENHFEGGEKIFFRWIILRTSVTMYSSFLYNSSNSSVPYVK